MDTKLLRHELFLLTNKFHSLNRVNLLTGTSRSEFFTLEVIYRYMQNNQNQKGIYVSELAKCQNVSSPSVSRTLKSMEEKGWIGRDADPRDRRNTYVYLTEAGKAKKKEIAETMERLMERVIERMGYEKMKQLLTLANDFEDAIRLETQNLLDDQK